jgi:hypothetical protein
MNSNISKSQQTNINQTSINKNSEKNSPNQIPHREFKKMPFQSNDFLQQTEMNEKFFPPKTNYFVSDNNDKIKNCLQSPIIDYFSPTSNNYLKKYNSPEEIIEDNKNNKTSNSNNNSYLNNNKQNNEQNVKTLPLELIIQINILILVLVIFLIMNYQKRLLLLQIIH